VKTPHPSRKMKSLRLGRLKLVLLQDSLYLPKYVSLAGTARPCDPVIVRRTAAGVISCPQVPQLRSGQGLSRWPKGERVGRQLTALQARTAARTSRTN